MFAQRVGMRVVLAEGRERRITLPGRLANTNTMISHRSTG